MATLSRHRPPFWLLVVGIALVGIFSPRITGNGSFSALMALLLVILLFAKAIPLAVRVISVLAVLILVVMVLAYWLLTSAGF
jgi:hypothetical protein